MNDDLFDHYAREFRTALPRRRRTRARRAAVPAVVALTAAAAVVALLPGGNAPTEREVRPAQDARSPVLEVPPPPAQLRDDTIGFMDRSGDHRYASIHSSMSHAGWKLDSTEGEGPPVPHTSVAYVPGRRADAELLALTLGMDRVAEASLEDRVRDLTIIVGQQAAFDDAARAAATIFPVIGPDGRGSVDTDYGRVNVHLTGTEVCLTTPSPSDNSEGGICGQLANAANGSMGIIFGNLDAGLDQPFRAIGLVPRGIDHVVFHGERVPVSDNIWAAPPSRGPRKVDIPGIGTRNIPGLSG